jgi:hypothetical protein
MRFAARSLTGRGSALAAVLFSLLVIGSLSVVRATAAGGPEFLVQFGSTGVGAGQLTNARGVATDPETGHVYVAELTNQRISEFTAWGEFVKAWGFGVADGTTPALQTCGPEATPPTATCKKGVQGTGRGGFRNPQGVAVDSNGNVYVTEFTSRRVQKFDSQGNFLLMFGGEVNKTKVQQRKAQEQNLEPVTVTKQEENLCPVAPSDECQTGVGGSGQGQFDWTAGAVSVIAVSSTGVVHVGDKDRVQKFNPDGTFSSEIKISEAGMVEGLSVDPDGNIYVITGNAPRIRKLSPSGTVLDTITEAVNGRGESVTIVPAALATDSLGNLFAVDDQPDELGQPDRLQVLKFAPDGGQKASFGEGEFTDSSGVGVNPIGNVYVINKSTTNSYVRAYGPLPHVYGAPPEALPEVVSESEHAASVGTTSAVVRAAINPHFFPTTYYVEYGPADCSEPGAACLRQPAPPGAELASQRERAVPTNDVLLSALMSGAVYHYRFVATSENGTVFGPNRTFKTHLPGSFALPDDRAFEMVSPPAKNSAEVGAPGTMSGLSFSPTPLQASLTGDAIAYPSFTAFGEAESASAATTYLSRRSGAGWSTANITPENEESRTWAPFRSFSSDLSFAALIQKEPKLDPAAVEGFENLYLRDNRTAPGSLRALTTETPRGPDAGVGFCVGFAGASADSEHVILTAKGALTPDAPEESGFSLYEWTEGELSLVSVLPSGEPAHPSASASFGAGGDCEMDQAILHNAISADGSRIFWTTGGQLFARIDGTETVQLDARQGDPGPAGGSKFWAASDDGSKVFFTSPNKLTSDASGGGVLGDLYLYDFDAEPDKRLTDLTVDPTPGSDPPVVQGVLGASEDGAYVYFVANGVLDDGAIAGQRNLYVWHRGEGLHFIRTLSQDDEKIGNGMDGWVHFSGASGIDSSWSRLPGEQVARVTPDGRHLAFVSVASLTGYDNIGQGSGEPVSQVYLYSADSDTLACVSCNPSGARPIGFSELPVWVTPHEQPRYLSDDGGRLFFLSHDALVLRDTNGMQDVYEFEREGLGSCTADSTAFSKTSGGCLYLVSTGNSGEHSFFLDASPEGRDVFLSTRERLVPADEDERFDVYDARVGGGFPPPPPPPDVCVGEACRPADPAPPAIAPASPGFIGEGNLRPQKKGKPARNCRKKRGAAKRRCIRKRAGHLRARDRRQRRMGTNSRAAR